MTGNEGHMGENDKRLRQEIHETRQNVANGELWLHVRLSKMMDLLDAILSEHRADVEQLTAERESWRILAEKSRIRAESARDAALEEARDILGGAFREVEAIKSDPRYRAGAKDLHAAAQARLAALKSKPARKYVDVELSLDGDAQS